MTLSYTPNHHFAFGSFASSHTANHESRNVEMPMKAILASMDCSHISATSCMALSIMIWQRYMP